MEIAADVGDEEAVAALSEKAAFDRVKERMDMRHKNTSKWAKMAMAHGHADKSLRFVLFYIFSFGKINRTLLVPIQRYGC